MFRLIPMIIALATLSLIAACGSDDDADVLEIDDFQVTPYIENLDMPGAMAFTPDGRLLFTEVHTGQIRVVEDGELREEPFAELEVARPDGYTEHGLLGMALHPAFEENGYVYAFYTATDPAGEPDGQRIVRLTDDDGYGIDETVLVDDLPFGPSCCHNGGRIVFGPDGYLYATIGDIEQPSISQNPDLPAGSVLRYTEDGAIPDDNPFGPDNPVYAYGLRNPFGMAIHPETGDLFLTENGPDGYDEVNLIQSGGNYGWPEVQGIAEEDEFIDPIWSTTTERVAPTGIHIPSTDETPELAGRVLFCIWNLSMLMALELDPDDHASVVDQSELPVNCNLDVVTGPDGAIYTSTDIRIYRYGPAETD
ncbi:MAG: PQQ-dependent sugar dehydrogenase [Sphaerobacteraceae bacterium]|nr:MAG: PQQ-dependent sugar dehydrogenase [Sphaerobacteraceae bacterium]